ncbi:hypothetical protein [Paenibacillus sp. URB8-2]|uniref:hypothetical protein n=1 Tax=Paenibacillus sp. URB8-2 TaxID=2741301 RepID=UPI0015C21000|nr:hypothetical protein [Paenibacillus sp. URB8-2]BCG60667.1 hypothetical protein PUR_40920 [Paenibacillus sp. URB8-2]
MRKGIAMALTAFMVISMLPVTQAFAKEKSQLNYSVPQEPGEIHTEVANQPGNGGLCTIDLVPIGSKLADLDWGYDAYFPINSVSVNVEWDDGSSSSDTTTYGLVNATYHPTGSLQHQYSSTGPKEVWYDASGYMEFYTLNWWTNPFADSDVIR